MLFDSKFPKISRKSLFEAFFTIGGRIVSIFLVVGTTKFLTTFLSEKDFGQLALYNSIATLPSLFYFGPLGQGIMRYLPVARENKEIAVFDREYNQLFRYGAAATMVIGVVAGIIFWHSNEKQWGIACLLIAILNVFNGINTYRYGLQNMARKRMLSLALETGSRVLQQMIAIGLLLMITDDPLIALMGYSIASFIFFFINQYYYRKTFLQTNPAHKKTVEKMSGHYSRDILQYSWPFFLFGAMTWFQTASDRWALEVLRSTESVAQYSVLNQIGFQSIVLLFGSFSYFLFPILLNRAGNLQSSAQFDAANHLNNWYLGFNIAFCGVFFLLFWWFGPAVIRLLSSEQYVPVAKLLPFMVIAGGLFVFGQNYSNRFALSMQTGLLVYPKIVTAVIGVLLNILFVNYFGLQGLVTAVIITQVVYVALLIVAWKWKGRHGKVSHSVKLSQNFNQNNL